MNASSTPHPMSSNIDDQRNVWNIVWSCLVTIFSCVWIAIHPNIPASTDTQIMISIRRGGLMMCALIAPEVITLWAMKQWYSARQIALLHTEKGWTTTHGFFIQMGGFMLYSDDKPLRPLLLEELEELHRMGKVDWPSITVEEIEDKSKGDALAKSLVILQTTWFLAQCIVRKVNGFLLTELELVTLAFATLNAVTYFFWWYKPLDIRCQIPVKMKPEPGNERLSTRASSITHQNGFTRGPSQSGGGLSELFYKYLASIVKSTKRLCSKIRRSFREKVLIINFLAQLHYLAVAFFHIFLRIINTINGHSPDGDLRVPTFYAAHLTSRSNPRVFLLMSILCAIIGTVFGAIHCIAWFFNFPSLQERLLWRISSLVVTLAPITIVLLSYYVSRQASSFSVSSGTYNVPITIALTWPNVTQVKETNPSEMVDASMDNIIDEIAELDRISTQHSAYTLPSVETLSWRQLFRALMRLLKRLRQNRQLQAPTSTENFPSSSWRLLFAVLARICYRLVLLLITTTYILARFTLIFLALTSLRDLSPGTLRDVEWTDYIPHL